MIVQKGASHPKIFTNETCFVIFLSDDEGEPEDDEEDEDEDEEEEEDDEDVDEEEIEEEEEEDEEEESNGIKVRKCMMRWHQNKSFPKKMLLTCLQQLFLDIKINSFVNYHKKVFLI